MPRASRAGPAREVVSDPHYYAARDLDVYPVPRTRLALGTLEALGASTAGHARLELHIDEAGVVRRVDVIDALSGLAAEAARLAFASARFVAARKDGQPVRSRIVVEVTFGTHPAASPQLANDTQAATGAAAAPADDE
jgi:periplasmic protein TonB